LSPDQRAEFDANGFFEVTGSHTGRRYLNSSGHHEQCLGA
jgi:hypothetical protein